MEQEIETIDSANDDEVIEDEVENADSENGDEDTEEDSTKEYTPREKSLYAQLQKAKGFKLVDGKWVKPAAAEPKKPTSNDFGYDVKAYLKASGITAAEFDFVKKEMKRSGISDVDELLENDYFKSNLEKHREVTRTQEATPSGKRSGGAATNSVDYWLAKPFEEVPMDMRRKVLKAKQDRESSGSQFYNSKS